MSPKAEGHHTGGDKMCALTCCACDLNVKQIKLLVNNPKFICESCGRVANEKKNLCQPTEI